MNNNDFDYAQDIPCDFKIIQNPDLQHLNIAFTPILPDSDLDAMTLSLKLHPHLEPVKAKQLENLLNEYVESLSVTKKSN